LIRDLVVFEARRYGRGVFIGKVRKERLIRGTVPECKRPEQDQTNYNDRTAYAGDDLRLTILRLPQTRNAVAKVT
jgi:hypothetical protein